MVGPVEAKITKKQEERNKNRQGKKTRESGGMKKWESERERGENEEEGKGKEKIQEGRVNCFS